MRRGLQQPTQPASPPEGRWAASLWSMCAGWLCGFGEVAWLVSDGLAPSMLEWVLALGVSAGSWGLCLAVLGAFRGGHRRGALQVLLVCWPILCGLHGRWAMAVLWAAVAMLALRGRSSLAALAAVVTLAWEVRPALPGEEGPQTLVITMDGVDSSTWSAMPEVEKLGQRGRRLMGVVPSSDSRVTLDALMSGHTPWGVGGKPLSVRAQEQGCHTGAFLAGPRTRRPGFSAWDDLTGTWSLSQRTIPGAYLLPEPLPRRNAREVISAAARWLDGRQGCFFAWVHLDDSLEPFDPPSPFDQRYYRGTDPMSPMHAGLPHGLAARYPGVRDPEFIRALYLGEVAASSKAIESLVQQVDGSVAVIVLGLGGLSWTGPGALQKTFDPGALEVPVAIRGDAAVLGQVVGPSDIHAWLSGRPVEMRPWAVEGDMWGVRSAESWRVYREGRAQERFPIPDPRDQARRRRMLDIEEQRLRSALDSARRR